MNRTKLVPVVSGISAFKCAVLWLIVASHVADLFANENQVPEDLKAIEQSTTTVGTGDQIVEQTIALGEVNPNPILVVDADGFSGERIRAMAISADGQWLAAAGNKEIRVWNIPSGKQKEVIRGNRDPEGFPIGNVHDIYFTPDGKYLLAGVAENSEQGSTRVYAMSDLSRLHRLLAGHTGCCKQIATTGNGRRIASAGCGHFLIWDRDLDSGTGSVVLDGPINPGPHWKNTNRKALGNAFCFFGDDHYLLVGMGDQACVLTSAGVPLVATAWPAQVKRFDRVRERLPYPASKIKDRTLERTVAVGKDLMSIVGGDYRRTAQETRFWVGVWVGDAVNPTAVYESHQFSPSKAAICPNPILDLIATADELGHIHVWHYRTTVREWKEPLKPKARPLWGVRWTDDQQLAYAPRPYGQDGFDFNRYGPLVGRFYLHERHLSEESRLPDSPRLVVSQDGPKKVEIDLPQFSDEHSSAVLRFSGEAVTFAAVPERITAYAAGPVEGTAIPVFLGTQNGGVFEYLVDLPKLPEHRKIFQSRRRFVGHTGMITGLSLSSDKTRLATSSLDGTLRIYPLDQALKAVGDVDFECDGNRVKKGPRLGIDPAKVHVDDRILTFDGMPFYSRLAKIAQGLYKPGQLVTLTLLRDGKHRTVEHRLVEASRIVEPIVSTLLTQDDQWIAWTPRGIYDSSPNAQRFLGWHINQGSDRGAQFFAIGQFPGLYQPHTISRNLQTKSVEEGLEREQPFKPSAPNLMDLRESEAFERHRPPDVIPISPADGAKEDSETLEVNFEVVASEKQPVTDARVVVNGVVQSTAAQVQGQAKAVNGVLRTKYSQAVRLSPGENRLGFFVRNHDAINDQVSILVKYVGRPPVKSGLPTLAVLSIGVSEYENPAFNLKYAHADARQFAAIWPRQRGVLYGDVQITELLNKAATVKGIEKALESLARAVKQNEDSVALVFIAGHALYDNDHYWHFMTHDVKSTDELAGNTITANELMFWLENKLGNNSVLFVDTCYAAGVNGLRGVKTVLDQPIPWHNSRRFVLAGSCQWEPAKETSKGNGAFTETLLEAFKDRAADTTGDGFLNLDELRTYSEMRLRQSGVHQVPTLKTTGSPPPALYKYFDK